MLKHIVWWALKDEAEGASASENAVKIKDKLEALIDQIEELKTIEVSLRLHETTTVEASLVLQTTHENTAGLSAYNNHPKHLEAVDFIKKVISSRQAIDYSI